MSGGLSPRGDPASPVVDPSVDETGVYQVRVKGHLGLEWTNWFGGLTIAPQENGDTLLTGPIVDQAALYGLLRKVRDLGMTLVSVAPIDLVRQETSEAEAPREALTKE